MIFWGKNLWDCMGTLFGMDCTPFGCLVEMLLVVDGGPSLHRNFTEKNTA